MLLLYGRSAALHKPPPAIRVLAQDEGAPATPPSTPPDEPSPPADVCGWCGEAVGVGVAGWCAACAQAHADELAERERERRYDAWVDQQVDEQRERGGW